MTDLVEKLDKYRNTVFKEIIDKVPVKEKDALRGISYNTEQKEASKKDKQDFLKRFSDFIPKAENILNNNMNDIKKKYNDWKKTDSPPKTTTKARLVLVGAVITSLVAAGIPILAALLPQYTWISLISIPEIIGGSVLLNRYDKMKANINAEYTNWKGVGDSLLAKIESIDRTIDNLRVLEARISFYVEDDNIMANEYIFESIKLEAEMLMKSVLG